MNEEASSDSECKNEPACALPGPLDSRIQDPGSFCDPSVKKAGEATCFPRITFGHASIFCMSLFLHSLFVFIGLSVTMPKWTTALVNMQWVEVMLPQYFMWLTVNINSILIQTAQPNLYISTICHFRLYRPPLWQKLLRPSWPWGMMC